MITYPWFDQVPPELRTRAQLAEEGLSPRGPACAQVVWKRGTRWAYLFPRSEAKPKKTQSAAQRAALEKARAAQEAQRCTCRHCGRLRPARVGDDPCDLCEEDERAGARAAACERARRLFALGDRAVVLDVETTDLDGFAVEIAVVSIEGAVLLNTRVNPEAEISEGAQRVHGIAPEVVVGAPTFRMLAPQIEALLTGRRVISYNADHDAGVLGIELARIDPSGASTTWFKGVRWHCAMRLYAEFIGEWSDYHGSYRYQPLPAGDHTAVGDCLATLQLLRRLAAAPADQVTGACP